MADELAGKVAIVTGGCSGIGRGAVERFLAEDARVVIADIDRDRGQQFAAECGSNAVFKQTDVSQPDQVGKLVSFAAETYGGLQVMVNNAGISGVRHSRLIEDGFDDFEQVMAVNLLGVMVGTREAGRQMMRGGGGSIINISSIGGIQSAPGLWSYHVSKAAVIMFTKCAAVDLGEDAIRVNCIAPGNIETPILSSVMTSGMPAEDREQLMDKIRQFLLSRQPLHRQGTTSDLAEAILYFASDRSAYVTGTLLPVDGGMLAGNPAAASGFEATRTSKGD